EHVRSILSQQQQQQNGTSLINLGNGAQMNSMNIMPSSSSTTLYRVSNLGRRSHGRHRHHRSSESGHESSRHRRHRRHHNNTVNNSQISFDMNRRGLHDNSEIEQQNQLTSIPENSRPVEPSTNVPQTSNKTTNSNSANLRDRIAKLIKDIVVHHGDNIQYVQLGDNLSPGSQNRVQENTNQQNSSNETNVSNISQNSQNSEDDEPLIKP
ncbi:unnamed protein product, partial [Brachionus calyciflorus]